ncbi:hypothetical protein A0J61_09154 [Choanephora cucurbitarum]|uniref:Globin-sensor domain-containing protein n=1 Tax=Choanephora cucurbitarum TaxID=101091 RepID=A0A1C7N277_9FUNG|nr:hypothetical protein A0J61_09154 [Choanephora cucurbitarum]
MGFVESVLAGGLISLGLDHEVELKALLAFNKVLWIQNDYFAKYYCNPATIHDAKAISSDNSFATRLASPSNLLSMAIGIAVGALGVCHQFRRT